MIQEVLELMENAEENGYPVWDWDPEELAEDIIYNCGGQFDESDLPHIIKAIRYIQNKKL
jgi:hypothetical protein